MTSEPGDLPSSIEKPEPGGVPWIWCRARRGNPGRRLPAPRGTSWRGVWCVDGKSGNPDAVRAPSVTAAAAVTVLVCETCRSETGADTHPRDGARLADAVEAAASGSAVAVSRVACLGNCKRRLSAAMVRPGAWSYVFGDLTLASGADLITGALLFAQSTDGLMPWRGRPQSLKGGLIARLPPLERMKATE